MNIFECPNCGSKDYIWVETTTAAMPQAEIYRCLSCGEYWDELAENTTNCINCGDEE